MAELSKYTYQEKPTSTKFNAMVDAVNANTEGLAGKQPLIDDLDTIRSGAAAGSKLGDLSNLTTTAKTTAVSAINEVNAKTDNIKGKVTYEKRYIVSSSMVIESFTCFKNNFYEIYVEDMAANATVGFTQLGGGSLFSTTLVGRDQSAVWLGNINNVQVLPTVSGLSENTIFRVREYTFGTDMGFPYLLNADSNLNSQLTQLDLKVGELDDLDDSVKESEGTTTLVSAINKAAQMGGAGGSATDGETVRIVLTTSVEGVSVAGKTVYMYLNDTTTNPEVLTTDSSGMVAKKVPTDYKYRLVFPDIEGCDSIPDVVHTAVLRERSIEVEYKAASPDKEAVTIYCLKYEQGVSGVYAGKVVKVTIGTQTAEYTTDSNGKVAIEIVAGTTYTVSTDAVDDYYLHGEYSKTFTASKTQRHIYFDFHNTGVGLFLVDNNGAEYTYDEWVDSGNDGSTAVAIKFATSPLISNGGVYYILLDDVVNKSYVTKYRWCDQNVQFNNIPLNGNNVSAEFYYNGKGATAAIIDEASNRGLFVDAASFCNSKTKQLDNGQTLNGFLYSVGQDRVIFNNVTPLNALLALVRPSATNNFSTLLSVTKWTSTQYNATYAYSVATSVSTSTKLNGYGVLVAYA